MPTWLTGILTGGFSFLSQWWEGKKEQAQAELEIKKAQQETENTIRLKQATAEIENDGISLSNMNTSWKDEWWLILFSLPLIAMFLSPFLDIFLLYDTYKAGMLADAAKAALINLSDSPDWYSYIVSLMVSIAYGRRQGIDKLFTLFSKKKN